MKMKNVVLILFVCLLSLSILGCSKSDSENAETNKEPEKAESLDVCTLVTKEEAEEAIGMEVEDGEFTEQEAIGQKHCFYDGKEDSLKASFVQITLLRTEDMPDVVLDSGQTANSIYDDLKANVENKAAVEGIGDDAFWGTGGLYVITGDIYFNVAVGNTDVPENMEICKKLAEIVMTRIH